MRVQAWCGATLGIWFSGAATAQTVDLTLNQSALDAGLDEAAIERTAVEWRTRIR